MAAPEIVDGKSDIEMREALGHVVSERKFGDDLLQKAGHDGGVHELGRLYGL